MPLESHEDIYRKHHCLMATGIIHVDFDKQLKILIANFSKHTVKLNAEQVFTSTKWTPEVN